MKILLIAALSCAFALLTLPLLTGCRQVETALQNETVKTISLTAAKALVDFGLSAVASNNPEYATELNLAKSALTLRYDTVFANVDGGPLTVAQVAANLRAQLAENISDPAMVAQLQAELAKALSALDTSGVPASGAEDLDALAHALAAELS